MCSQCSQVITAFVRANLGSNVATDVYRFARDLHQELPHIPEAELVALIDAAVINTWGAAAIWDRSSPGTVAAHAVQQFVSQLNGQACAHEASSGHIG